VFILLVSAGAVLFADNAKRKDDDKNRNAPIFQERVGAGEGKRAKENGPGRAGGTGRLRQRGSGTESSFQFAALFAIVKCVSSRASGERSSVHCLLIAANRRDGERSQ